MSRRDDGSHLQPLDAANASRTDASRKLDMVSNRCVSSDATLLNLEAVTLYSCAPTAVFASDGSLMDLMTPRRTLASDMEDESLPERSSGTASGGFAGSCGRSSICLSPPGVPGTG